MHNLYDSNFIRDIQGILIVGQPHVRLLLAVGSRKKNKKFTQKVIWFFSILF